MFKKASGFTMVEVASTIAVLAILSGFAILSFGQTEETRDAAMVEAGQATLQQIISQGSTRMDVAPAALPQNTVLRAAQDYMMQNAGVSDVTFASAGTSQFALNITGSSRSATYRVQPTGQVDITVINGFNHHVVQNGKLQNY